eukprot:CAMPEP_0117506624 /NCGR_PEP_ID=MMETSP0784-20121206/26004_1 /TAXON_ID=39447 /ORGANISM="" /LENGTH=39 /DNA_ID= /DNA_START= /DNA_END= /DNA_ORIENTATION=
MIDAMIDHPVSALTQFSVLEQLNLRRGYEPMLPHGEVAD